jgi:hypothetical protein
MSYSIASVSSWRKHQIVNEQIAANTIHHASFATFLPPCYQGAADNNPLVVAIEVLQPFQLCC